jgi:glucokinase
MQRTVLGGDIGGTKTILALYLADDAGTLSPLREAAFASRRYKGLEEVLAEFLAAGSERVASGAFGIAGPVIDGTVVTTNLPWRVESSSLARTIGCERVRLMNDLETTALGALHLLPGEMVTVHEGVARRGNRAVIAAGTGLGQAFLFWNGARYDPAATEGGHADFAPRNDFEIDLLRFLLKSFPRVSYERLLSGPGLLNIFRFLDEGLGRPVDASVRRRMQSEDPSAVVGEAGVAGTCATCGEAVETFVSLYGAQAGNLALSVFAVGGVYIGGGIVIKLLPKMNSETFLRSFREKGRYENFMSEIPIYIILNPKASLRGAAEAAFELLD